MIFVELLRNILIKQYKKERRRISVATILLQNALFSVNMIKKEVYVRTVFVISLSDRATLKETIFFHL